MKNECYIGQRFSQGTDSLCDAFFLLAQGLCFSSWASRIPDVKDIFEVNYALLLGLGLVPDPGR